MDEYVITEAPADSAGVRWCFGQYYAELGALFDYDVDDALPLGLDQLTRPRGLVLVVREGDAAVGCGALKLLPDGIGEIKRMWISPTMRGRGVGGRLLEALEAEAAAAGKTHTRLETNQTLATALTMYRSRGYREVEPFNDEPFGTHWLVKELAQT
jgi:GNAT superfamily N-acetyltransferase